MNGDNSKATFAEWASTSSRAIPQCNPAIPCNLAHSTAPQDELLLRTKAQWEKQQAAAAAAMCYWGYSEQNPLMFTKSEWRQMSSSERTTNTNPAVSTQTSPIDHNGQIQIPRCVEQPSNGSKRESRIGSQQRQEVHTPSKKRRSAPLGPPTMVPCGSSVDLAAGSSLSKPFPCTDCCKTFRQHSQLLTHQRTHTGDRPYLCTDCPKAFRTQGTLAIHRRIHTGEKPYSCEECGRTFRTQGTLVIHRRTHTGDRPYKCQDCGKAFAARCSLVVHWRTHTGEKPYMCTECGKLFASRSDSARHTRTHQAGSNDGAGPSVSKPPCFPCTVECRGGAVIKQQLPIQRLHQLGRPYLCTDCPKAFRTQGTLTIHRRIHTGENPYSCEECGRTFRTQGTLVIHRRTHTGDRPYKCQDCSKAFAARCSLVVHWRTHTGEKPYMCTECGKLFASRSDSARHTRTHQAEFNSGKSKAYIKRIMQQHPALQ